MELENLKFSTCPAPFSDDPIAVARREVFDYSIKVTLEEAHAGKARRQVRVYADGVYDMFHSGHARQLWQAKTAFKPRQVDVYLIVGVKSDAETHFLKGKTVMTEQERYEIVRHCRYVDEVHRGGPFYPDEEFIRENKIDFIAHDGEPYPYADGSGDAYDWAKRTGIFLATQRTESISITQIITRIVSDYDSYLLENLKHGCSPSNNNELGTGKADHQQLTESTSTDEEIIANNKSKTITSLIEHWEARSRDLIRTFIGMFERGTRLGAWLRSYNNNNDTQYQYQYQRLMEPPLSAEAEPSLSPSPSIENETFSVTSCDDTDSFADDCDFAEIYHLEIEHVK